MKKKFYIGLVLLTAVLSGCNNWLDVKPETEMTQDEMYAEQQGFQDVLTGAYLNMKAPSAYGKSLMYGTVEYLAQHWDYHTGDWTEEVSQFNYRNKMVQDEFSVIYSQLYKVIVSVNVLLEEIDGKRDVFEEGMYEIIKGEALAMRAYCHLDVLRLFGPMPSKTNGGRILPYVRTVSLNLHEHLTYAEFTKRLEEDLLLAEDLLKDTDPIIAEVDAERNKLSVAAESFLTKRQIRFNYYAVKATEARFYLWLGGVENLEKAYTCAMEVINAQNSKGTALFTLGSSKDFPTGDFSFSSEHILAIYDYNLEETAKSDFTVESPYNKKKDVLSPDLYPSGTTDIRRISLWEEYTANNGSKSYTIKKYLQDAGAMSRVEKVNQLPLIRLSEMYFIAMESGTLAEANELYEAFCRTRDIPVIEFRDEMQIRDVLTTEYNKEFYGEGQAFYAYKRMAVENILWALFPGDEESYVIPLPLGEINYGN